MPTGVVLWKWKSIVFGIVCVARQRGEIGDLNLSRRNERGAWHQRQLRLNPL